MTPQEAQLVEELFDRLAKLETTPRDPAAERLIADGLRQAPHAVYALVQTVLVQDEALKRANARIEELQAQLDEPEEPEQRQGSFLDSARTAAFGQRETRGSVPSVRTSASQSQAGYPPQAPGPEYSGREASPASAMGPGLGAGGSFLGTAASTAAGVIGGALLLDGIRSMFGHHFGGGYGQSGFGNLAGEQASPWAGSASGSQLARDAGIDHVGEHAADSSNNPSQADAEPFEAEDDQDLADDTDVADDDEIDVADDDNDFVDDWDSSDDNEDV